VIWSPTAAPGRTRTDYVASTRRGKAFTDLAWQGAPIPQGAGDARTGHRCPGEDVTVALLASLAVRLARPHYDVPEEDLTIRR
jgi:hypothetical protein